MRNGFVFPLFFPFFSFFLCAVANAEMVRGQVCFPQTEEEIVRFYRHGECGNRPVGLEAKGFAGKGITIAADRAAVLFEFNAARIQPAFFSLLDQWGRALQRLPELRFRLEGHADMIGGDEVNQQLSEQRARVLKDYLVHTFGISPSRLTVQGYGESRPLEGFPPSPAESARRWNRRVELVKLN